MTDAEFFFVVVSQVCNLILIVATAEHSRKTRDMVRRLDQVILKHLQDGASHL